jgi:hypothetical protein
MVWKVPSSSEQSLITAYLYYMPGHGEEPLRAVDFDVAFPAVEYIASNYDVESGTSRGEFRVAIEVADYFESPRGYLATFAHAVIQVDARVRISA